MFYVRTISCKSNPAINVTSTNLFRLKPKKILRHAKARQVSEPVLWRDRSQACQDLLGHEKAAESKSFEEDSQGMRRLDKVSKPVLGPDKSPACQDLLVREKASRLQGIRKVFYGTQRPHQVSKPVLRRDRSDQRFRRKLIHEYDTR